MTISHLLGAREFSTESRLFGTLHDFLVIADGLVYAETRLDGDSPKLDEGGTLTLVCRQFPAQIAFPVLGPFFRALNGLAALPITG